MKIATFTVNPFGENTYVIIGDNKDCIIVDAGFFSDKERDSFAAFIAKNELKPVLALNTHGHIDHVCGVQWVKDTYNVPFALSSGDMEALSAVSEYGAALGFKIDRVPIVEQVITDGDIIELGGDKLRIIATAGHTAGGVCIYIESQKMLITGDTLFKESIGRTDLPTGDYDMLMSSIVNKILPLGGDVTFFPGHGGSSTLSHEAAQNPFIAEVLLGDMSYNKR